MKLISEKWANYVEAKKTVLATLHTTKEDIYTQLTTFNLRTIKFELGEDQADMSTEFTNFLYMELIFSKEDETNNHSKQRITVSIGDEYVPFAERNPKDNLYYMISDNTNVQNKSCSFADYFGLSNEDAYILESVFTAFTHTLFQLPIPQQQTLTR